MKKSTLLKIYKELGMTECLTNYLYKLSDLKGDAEYIFLDFCKKYKSMINEENIEYIMQLSSSLCSIDILEYRRKLIDSIDDMLDDDYINSNVDFDKLLENIIYILTIDVSTTFECEGKEDFDYYMTEILCKFIKGLCDCSKNVKEKLYSHDMKSIIENFFEVLEDLNRTVGDSFEDSNSNILKRIQLYLDIIFDKNIFEMNEKKYMTVVDIAKTIEDNNSLSKLKPKALIIRNLDDEEFIDALDDNVEELTETTINRIYGKLKIKNIYDNDSNTTVGTDKEINEFDVINKILSFKNPEK